MSFSLRQIEVIRAVIRTGSLTDAARFLGVSQPAVSSTLKQAAEVASFPLFRREQGRLAPTSEALALLPDLDRIVQTVVRLEALMNDVRVGSAGSVRIAVTPALATSLMPAALQAFGARHPNVRIVVDTLLNADSVDSVRAGMADLALVMSSNDVWGAKTTTVWDAALVCVVHASDPLAEYPSISPEDLQGQRLISFSRSIPLGALVDDAFRKRGVRREVAVEVGPSALACALVASGAGCAVVDPFSPRQFAHMPIRMLPFEPSTRIAAQLVVHETRPLSRAAHAFRAALQQTVRSWATETEASVKGHHARLDRERAGTRKKSAKLRSEP